jgi:hypothetical protein
MPTIPKTVSPECQDFMFQCWQRDHHKRPFANQLLRHPFLTKYQEAGAQALMYLIKEAHTNPSRTDDDADDADETDLDDMDDREPYSDAYDSSTTIEFGEATNSQSQSALQVKKMTNSLMMELDANSAPATTTPIFDNFTLSDLSDLLFDSPRNSLQYRNQSSYTDAEGTDPHGNGCCDDDDDDDDHQLSKMQNSSPSSNPHGAQRRDEQDEDDDEDDDEYDEEFDDDGDDAWSDQEGGVEVGASTSTNVEAH